MDRLPEAFRDIYNWAHGARWSRHIDPGLLPALFKYHPLNFGGGLRHLAGTEPPLGSELLTVFVSHTCFEVYSRSQANFQISDAFCFVFTFQ